MATRAAIAAANATLRMLDLPVRNDPWLVAVVCLLVRRTGAILSVSRPGARVGGHARVRCGVTPAPGPGEGSTIQVEEIDRSGPRLGRPARASSAGSGSQVPGFSTAE